MQLPRLSGLGPETQRKLSKLGISHVQSLLWHVPLRYENRAQLTPIADLQDGQTALIQGEIQRIITGAKTLTVLIQDATGSIALRLFQQHSWQTPHLVKNNWLRCYGVVQAYQNQLQMLQPDWSRCTPDEPIVQDDRYTPIYPTTSGLSQSKLRSLIQSMLTHAHTHTLLQPLSIHQQTIWPQQLLPLQDALQLLHSPHLSLEADQLDQQLEQARTSLAFVELLHHFAEVLRLQIDSRQAPALTNNTENEQRFLANLPFQLTDGQQQAWRAIAADLCQPQPMRRLLQGDVGCGKTIVSALAALAAVQNGYQVALMVPTEILAQQHLRSFQRWFAHTDFQIALLTGSLSAGKKRAIKTALQAGEIQIVIGTQALFQATVHFQQLGLVIIDEQHRFGVVQRLALVRRATTYIPHQLTLTATPIPRTLAMTLSGQREVSVIQQLPKGRKPIITAVMSEHKRPQLLQRIHHSIAQGEQVFWVCPLIEESELLTCEAAERTHQQLSEQLQDVRVGLLHGRMNEADKLDVLQAFRDQQLQLLVATSVIEVGVDIPNANLLIIENAERQGLAQLHQLRGRVGRGQQQGYCILLYHPPLGTISRQRLDILRQHTDGFLVSQHDLDIRGPGQWLGKQQSGHKPFRFAELPQDSALAEQAAAIAKHLHHNNPRLLQGLMTIWQPYEAAVDGLSLADG